MSIGVIQECLPGDIIYSINSWFDKVSCIEGIIDDEKTIIIEIGEKLLFQEAYRDKSEGNRPAAWCVRYKRENGYISSANQGYFVTEEEWQKLRAYIEKSLLNEDVLINLIYTLLNTLKNRPEHRSIADLID